MTRAEATRQRRRRQRGGGRVDGGLRGGRAGRHGAEVERGETRHEHGVGGGRGAHGLMRGRGRVERLGGVGAGAARGRQEVQAEGGLHDKGGGGSGGWSRGGAGVGGSTNATAAINVAQVGRTRRA
ncbi:hypothetical protein FGB62_19g034 [Gracilaria domingensis]|nr:hypothetical protein FGB62_19g034 [Gracilaria domingensis]